MYLLILLSPAIAMTDAIDLHSIMYLLIQLDRFLATLPKDNLHSIMYLLILKLCIKAFNDSVTFTFHNVSINSCWTDETDYRPVIFTFHNVSINSNDRILASGVLVHLHSIMYLLILGKIAIIIFSN